MEINSIFYENEYSNAFDFIQNKNLTIEEISPDEKGRRFKISEIVLTPDEIKTDRIYEIQARLNQLSQDFIQMQLGAKFIDEEDRKEEFKLLHNELRELLGKRERIYE